MTLERATAAKTILDLCQRNRVTLSELCRAAGLKYTTLHAQIHNFRPIPFDTIDAVARHFAVPLELFSSRCPDIAMTLDRDGRCKDNQTHAKDRDAAVLGDDPLALRGAGARIGTDDVLDWLRAQNGRLSNFEALKEHVDLFHSIDAGDRIFRPYRIGRRGFAKEWLRAKDETHFRHILRDSLDQKLIDRAMNAHRAAAERPYMVSDESIDTLLDGARLRGAYRRIIAPVTDAQGRSLTLVHARRI